MATDQASDAGVVTDGRIEPDNRTAFLMADLAWLSYAKPSNLATHLRWHFNEHHDGAKFDFLTIEIPKTGTEAFFVWTDEIAVISVRGTEPAVIRDLLTDIRLTQDAGPFGSEHSKVHRGFWEAAKSLLNDNELIEAICEQQRLGKPLYLTGHSLGGAVATLTAAGLARFGVEGIQVYTFGSPRVGNHGFAALYQHTLPASFRYVHQDDLVTRMPWLFGVYRHTGILCFIDGKMSLSVRPSLWKYYLERYKTALSGLLMFTWGAFKDHSMLLYIAATAAQVGVHEDDN